MCIPGFVGSMRLSKIKTWPIQCAWTAGVHVHNAIIDWVRKPDFSLLEFEQRPPVVQEKSRKLCLIKMVIYKGAYFAWVHQKEVMRSRKCETQCFGKLTRFWRKTSRFGLNVTMARWETDWNCYEQTQWRIRSKCIHGGFDAARDGSKDGKHCEARGWYWGKKSWFKEINRGQLLIRCRLR